MRIIRLRDICRIERLCFNSFVFGLLLSVLLVAIPVMSVGASSHGSAPQGAASVIAILLAGIAFILGPICGLAICRIHVATFKRRLAAMFWTSTGLLSIMHIIGLIGVRFGEFRMLMAMLAVHAALVVIWSLLALGAWPIILRKLPFAIQDGEQCPRCGYCLRGVASRICPECGRPFGAYDLGLSFAEFERLVADQRSPIT